MRRWSGLDHDGRSGLYDFLQELYLRFLHRQSGLENQVKSKRKGDWCEVLGALAVRSYKFPIWKTI